MIIASACMGTGDLLIYKAIQGGKITLYPRYSMVQAYRPGAKGTHEFYQALSALIPSDNITIMDKELDRDPVDPLTLMRLCNLSSRLYSLPEVLGIRKDPMYRDRVLVHTKFRQLPMWNDSMANDLFQVLSRYKVAIIGERRVSPIHDTAYPDDKYTCIYGPMKEYFDIHGVDYLDLTSEDIMMEPSISTFKRDIGIMASCRVSVVLGLGGQFVMQNFTSSYLAYQPRHMPDKDRFPWRKDSTSYSDWDKFLHGIATIDGDIPVYTPMIAPYTRSAIKALNDGWVSNHGEFIQEATDSLKDILGYRHAILMCNGTAATHCMFLALKHKYPGISKIYVPNNVYVAAYNAALMVYPMDMLEVMPIDPHTWNMDTSEGYIMSLDKGAAILVVHNLGNVINVPRLRRLRPDLMFIEDNCEGVFGKYEGTYTGNASLCSSISFYGNKTITAGEGGAFVTNDDDTYDYIKRVYSQGVTDTRYVHDILAYNYRMTNIQAALLYDQLQDIDTILAMKKGVFHRYESLLMGDDRYAMQVQENDTDRAHWMFPIYVHGRQYVDTEEHMRGHGIDVRPFFYPIDRHQHLADISARDPVSNDLSTHIVILPSYPTLRMDQQERVVDTLHM